jgi:hypothetical protein
LKRKLLFAVARMLSGRQGNLMESGWEKQKHIQDQLSKAQREHMTGRTHTEETKEKIRQANTGRVVPEAQKKRQSEKMKGKYSGRTASSETKSKMSLAQKGKKKTKEHIEKINQNPEKIRKTAEKHRGMKRSEEAKEKMSKAKKGKFIPWNKGLKLKQQADSKNSMGLNESEAKTLSLR